MEALDTRVHDWLSVNSRRKITPYTQSSAYLRRYLGIQRVNLNNVMLLTSVCRLLRLGVSCRYIIIIHFKLELKYNSLPLFQRACSVKFYGY